MNSTDTTDNKLGQVVYVSYGISVVIVILFSWLEHDQRGRRPGITVPVDFLGDDSLLYAYAAAFGCTSSALLGLILNQKSFILEINVSDSVRPWVQVYIWLLKAIITSFQYYPIFAAIRHETIVIGPAVGFLYCGYLTGELIYTDIIDKKTSGEIYSLIQDVPIFACYAFLLAYFLYRGVHDVLQLTRRSGVHNAFTDIKQNTRFQRQYVKWLLQRQKTKENNGYGAYSKFTSYMVEIKENLNANTPLKTSPRVICTFVVCCIIMLQTGTLSVFAYQSVGKLENDLFSAYNINNTVYSSYLKTLFRVLDASFYVSIITSTLIMALYMILIYRNYQQDLRKMYRGDFSFLPKKILDRKSHNFVASSLRYSGTQIAYMFWCYLVMFVSLLFLCLALAYLLILPLMGKVSDSFLIPIKAIAPLFVAKYLFRFLQSVIVTRYFLQHHSVHVPDSNASQLSLALRNRKIFNVVSYFMFFFNVIIGFFGCISRICVGAVIGILTVVRIDGSLLPRGYEHLDSGYASYVGLLMLELYHRNPVLLVFCEELIQQQKNKSNDIQLQIPCENTLYQRSVSDSLTTLKRTRLRNKWFKAFTVVNNPTVNLKKKPKLMRGFSEHVQTDSKESDA